MPSARPEAGASERLSEKKNRAILEAAIEVFLEAGFEAASMDQIAQAAGVSKQTIYNHFGSKHDLFVAICNAKCDRLITPLLTDKAKASGIERALTSLAEQFMEQILAPDSVALHRGLMAEATRFPELGREVYRSGPRRAVNTLAAYVREQTERGWLCVDDPELAAEQFFGMLCGHLQLRALLMVEPTLDAERARHSTRQAVRTFLLAYGT